MTVVLAPGVGSRELDDLVAEICLTLQISPTQFDLARQHYEAVGGWLRGDGSPLARMAPMIYPQGSMALRTTVRPREREEYDLDLVLQVVPTDRDPMALYDLVADRLAAHADYRGRLERMKRCLRLTYAHDFHLDILPARLDPRRCPTCIEVPDTKLECWMPSNPLGYIQWFERQCETGPSTESTRKQLPLPAPLPENLTRVLRQAVQLIKRRRDNIFRGQDVAPRSVVLTTLAGMFYTGNESLVGALEGILAAIDAAIVAYAPRPIEVRNPTNAAELFSEAWANDAVAYQAFVKFVCDFRADLAALRAAEGVAQLTPLLDQMFGDDLGKQAHSRYMERMARAKRGGDLRFGSAGIIIGGSKRSVTETLPSPRHTFHHGGLDGRGLVE